jgi:hypothetical protein
MDGYREHSQAVAAAFVAAYTPYVQRKAVQLGVDDDAVREAIDEGGRRLSAAFALWADVPAQSQRASPLELFREALACPTARLIELGVASNVRERTQEDALPGDVFDVAPATSRDLGEEAWAAHVAWGIARTEAIAGLVPCTSPPAVGARAALVGTDLMDRTRITEAGKAAGYEVIAWRNPGAIDAGLDQGVPSIAFVDLTHPVANEAIVRLVGAGVKTIAFGPHVDDLAMAAAGALGAAEVLPRSRFFKRLPQLFPVIV